MKVCKKCSEEKTLSEFYPEPRNRDGLMGMCRSCVVARGKEWIRNNREKWRKMHAKRQRKWRYKNIDRVRDNKRNWALEMRKRVLAHYGPICKCCGETNTDFLTLDHVNEDGAEQRKRDGLQGGGAIYYWVRKNDFPDTIQVLCFNCNWSKHLKKNKGRCIHQIGKRSPKEFLPKKVNDYMKTIT